MITCIETSIIINGDGDDDDNDDINRNGASGNTVICLVGSDAVLLLQQPQAGTGRDGCSFWTTAVAACAQSV